MEISGKTGMEEKNTSLSQEKHNYHHHFMLAFPLTDTSKPVGLIGSLIVTVSHPNHGMTAGKTANLRSNVIKSKT